MAINEVLKFTLNLQISIFLLRLFFVGNFPASLYATGRGRIHGLTPASFSVKDTATSAQDLRFMQKPFANTSFDTDRTGDWEGAPTARCALGDFVFA